MEVQRTSTFWRDLEGILDFFVEKHSEQSAVSFLEALDDTVDFIISFPDLGHPWEPTERNERGMRYRLVKRFGSYVVFYVATERAIRLLRILHASQNIDALLS